MNEGYLKQKVGVSPVRLSDGTWELDVPGAGRFVCNTINRRQAYANLYDAFWSVRRVQVLERDKWRCRQCQDTSGLQVDHIKERSHGGTDAMENLRTLCWKCHHKRHFGGGLSPSV